MLSSLREERTLSLPPALPQMVQKLGTPLALPPAHTLVSLLGLALPTTLPTRVMTVFLGRPLCC